MSSNQGLKRDSTPRTPNFVKGSSPVASVFRPGDPELDFRGSGKRDREICERPSKCRLISVRSQRKASDRQRKRLSMRQRATIKQTVMIHILQDQFEFSTTEEDLMGAIREQSAELGIRPEELRKKLIEEHTLMPSKSGLTVRKVLRALLQKIDESRDVLCPTSCGKHPNQVSSQASSRNTEIVS